MKSLILVLGDQLSASLSSLRAVDPATATVLMAEVMGEATYVPHHKKKIAFLFSAMRHFAEDLRKRGFSVRYVTLDDPDNSQSLFGEVRRAVADLQPGNIVVTEPGEYRLMQEMRSWQRKLNRPVEIRGDDRFLCTPDEFREWAKGRKQLRMEFFYRDKRRRYEVLMEPDGAPTGGQWNFDQDNRKSPPKGLKGPKRVSHRKDAIVNAVLDMVEERFGDHFGTLRPFHFAVTAEQAWKEYEHFVEKVLPNFGDYQDAMVAGEPYLYHSLISSYLNAGLILPLQVIRRAEKAYRDGKAPLNAVEGFIRQILGWREYVRGLYWTQMPGYAERNHLNAKRPLPRYYWDGKTKMACMAAAIGDTIEHAYSHHIQRLMVTGNFALLAGIEPKQVCDWYLLVYADAYDWVELPNTLGMALYGDGGLMASKPYAASGKYIDRMSNFCGSCAYDVKRSTGDKACPFNALYWDFIARNEKVLKGNPRMTTIYASWNRMDEGKRQDLRQAAADVLGRLDAL
ncbi:cryptochrome/photolyase family protein [Rhizobium paknamense]|uniref:Deoxyribodipyrimidine photolyase-related protein n=1 Tax=Rhizobium paknamense TaxID=1206817 RepID=A0ABU0IE58_9HYPH|nr:cryptochrome/photolyase family protein [Rhizobium paknamense]MDQ0455499.1 deoxyribodipyrimidine photolyase-related protein [Rhizobium paknamense]